MVLIKFLFFNKSNKVDEAKPKVSESKQKIAVAETPNNDTNKLMNNGVNNYQDEVPGNISYNFLQSAFNFKTKKI